MNNLFIIILSVIIIPIVLFSIDDYDHRFIVDTKGNTRVGKSVQSQILETKYFIQISTRTSKYYVVCTTDDLTRDRYKDYDRLIELVNKDYLNVELDGYSCSSYHN